MRILGVDPSTTCTGVGIVEMPVDRPVLLAGELLKPTQGLPYYERVLSMVDDLVSIIREYRPDRAVIEMPHGKRHARRGAKNMASLAIYGTAPGALLAVLHLERVPTRAALVNEASQGMSKRKRQDRIRLLFPGYNPDLDRGMDLSDALFIAVTELTKGEKP